MKMVDQSSRENKMVVDDMSHSSDSVSAHSHITEFAPHREDGEGDSGDTHDLVKQENTRVNISKLLVYMVILLAAVVVGICTYFFMEGQEAVWFQDEVCFERGSQAYGDHSIH